MKKENLSFDNHLSFKVINYTGQWKMECEFNFPKQLV